MVGAVVDINSKATESKLYFPNLSSLDIDDNALSTAIHRETIAAC
jgi:hypothetical protein